jgi:(p)ppGpp synthase/HD superfamily hydrolase
VVWAVLSSMDPLRHVKFFAATKHANQTYGVLPYTHHLYHVEMVARRFGFNDEEFLIACWLHDVVEDTDTKLKEIREMFGEGVAKLVGAVTNEPGENRKIRTALTYPKIRKAGKRAVALKLCDRTANTEGDGSLGDMYRAEYEDFRHALYTAGENEELWANLDRIMTK